MGKTALRFRPIARGFFDDRIVRNLISRHWDHHSLQQRHPAHPRYKWWRRSSSVWKKEPTWLAIDT
jgi:hypothetical protein